MNQSTGPRIADIQPGETGYRAEFAVGEHSAAPLRRILRMYLDRSGLAELADAAELALTELVANVVRHVPGRRCRMCFLLQPGGVRVEVADDCPRLPVLGAGNDPTADGKRGLLLVDAVTDRWGVTPRPGGSARRCGSSARRSEEGDGGREGGWRGVDDPHSGPMSTLREELHELIDRLPESQVAQILVLVRENMPTTDGGEEWPLPEFVGTLSSRKGDLGVRSGEIMASMPWSPWSASDTRGFTARLVAGLVRTGNTAALRQALPDALPWSVFLPEEDFEVMLGELVDTARAAAAPENLAPVALLLAQWRHSAEIYAEPALHTIVTREPEGDLGAVPVPEGEAAEWSQAR